MATDAGGQRPDHEETLMKEWSRSELTPLQFTDREVGSGAPEVQQR